LIEKNLLGAVITVRTALGKDGAAYVIRRSGRQTPSLCALDGNAIQGVDLERGTFLPLDAYSSNEVEEIADEALGEKRRNLLDDLRGEELATIQVSIAERLRALHSNRDAVTLSRTTVANLKERIEELSDAPAKLAAIPAQPGGDSDGGLVRAARQLQANRQERDALDRVAAAAATYRDELARVADGLRAELRVPLVVEDSENKGLLRTTEAEIATSVDKACSLAAQAGKELDALRSTIAGANGRVAASHGAQDHAFAGLQEKNLVASQIVQNRTAAEQAVMKLRELEQQLIREEQKCRGLLQDRKQLKGAYLLEREGISDQRTQVANRLQDEAGDKVRIRVLRNADTYAYQQQLAAALQGARVRNHEDIVSALMRFRPEDLAQLIQENDVDQFDSQAGLGSERARKVLDSFREKIDPMQLEIVSVEDRVCIELNVASASEPNFKDASELSRGQKCTALLPILLARRETPLVIDQPEDNLDNHFIYETVVENIRRLKKRRQMVFITHNANIPVLGEAELVVVLDSDGNKGFVKKVGTLDECRDEIVDLLEGGKEAFELRRRRYAK
jgi:hypothetical protein